MIIDPFKLFIISIIKIVFRFFDWFYKLRMKKGKLLDEENIHWNCLTFYTYFFLASMNFFPQMVTNLFFKSYFKNIINVIFFGKQWPSIWIQFKLNLFKGFTEWLFLKSFVMCIFTVFTFIIRNIPLPLLTIRMHLK